MRAQLTFILAFLLLLGCSHALNWQGTGNMSISNMTTVWDYINANFSTVNAVTISSTIKAMSTYLNKIWDPAWNIVVVYHVDPTENVDSVVYGFAYWGHWLWYNGFPSPIGGYIAFIGWKDWNCHGWQNIDFTSSSTFDWSTGNKINDAIKGKQATSHYNDIWNAAVDISDALPNTNPGAYTVVVSQSNAVFFFATVCVKNYYVNTGTRVGKDGPKGDWGSSLVLQMR